MKENILDGLTILVADDDYFGAQESCTRLQKAGAAIAGPFAENSQLIEALDNGLRPDGAVLCTELRDGRSNASAQALRRHNVPFVLAPRLSLELDGMFSNAPVLTDSLYELRSLSLLRRTFTASLV